MTDLLDRARNGDKSAEKQLFEILHVRFAYLAKRRIRNKDDAEDVAQEACMTILEKYKTEVFTKGFDAWAYGVLRMKIGNYLQEKDRKRSRMAPESAASESAATAGSSPDSGIRRMLIDCLSKVVKINRRYGRALNLIHQGYRTDEICKRLSMSRNYLYVTLNRARSMLRLCLKTGEV